MKNGARRAVEAPAAPLVAGLSPAQDKALHALATGAALDAAAIAAGVPLGELLTWCASDPAFIGARNRLRRLVAEAHADQLRALAARALGTLAALLDAPIPSTRVKAAEALLRAGATLPAPSGGPESAEAVQEAWAEAEQAAERDRRLAALLAQVGP